MDTDHREVMGKEPFFLEKGFVFAQVLRKAAAESGSERQELYLQRRVS